MNVNAYGIIYCLPKIELTKVLFRLSVAAYRSTREKFILYQNCFGGLIQAESPIAINDLCLVCALLHVRI